MKRILLATVALAALAAPAAAADLATKYPVKAVAAVPVFSWTGFYIGGNVGYGGDSFDYNLDALGVPLATIGVHSSGFFAGGQLGYNYQFANNVVLGLETDIQWSDISGDVTGNFGGIFGPYATGKVGSSVDYFGTIRARLGYAFDRFLPYITGGVAYGKTNSSLSVGYYGAGVSSSSTNWGWTLGGGAEYAITNNWTFKGEYLYVDLGSVDLAGSYGFTPYSLGTDTKLQTFRLGVNYKF